MDRAENRPTQTRIKPIGVLVRDNLFAVGTERHAGGDVLGVAALLRLAGGKQVLDHAERLRHHVDEKLIFERLALAVFVLPDNSLFHHGAADNSAGGFQFTQVHESPLRGFLNPGGAARTLNGCGGGHDGVGREREWEVGDVALENEPGAGCRQFEIVAAGIERWRSDTVRPAYRPLHAGIAVRFGELMQANKEFCMSEKTVKAIMEQAQVFASSWSMVGGPFAADDQLERAEDEKSELEKLVAGALEGSVGAPQDVAEMVEALLAWHKRQVDQLQMVTDNAKEGVTLQLGTDDPIEIILTKDMAKGLRIGLVLALERLGKLPISVSHDGEDDPDSDDE